MWYDQAYQPVGNGNARKEGQREIGWKNIWSSNAGNIPNLMKSIHLSIYLGSSMNSKYGIFKDTYTKWIWGTFKVWMKNLTMTSPVLTPSVKIKK